MTTSSPRHEEDTSRAARNAAEGEKKMRAFYTSTDGRTADLCQMMYSERTRLTIHATGRTVTREYFSTWEDAIEVLRNDAHTWTNDLTGETLNASPV